MWNMSYLYGPWEWLQDEKIDLRHVLRDLHSLSESLVIGYVNVNSEGLKAVWVKQSCIMRRFHFMCFFFCNTKASQAAVVVQWIMSCSFPDKHPSLFWLPQSFMLLGPPVGCHSTCTLGKTIDAAGSTWCRLQHAEPGLLSKRNESVGKIATPWARELTALHTSILAAWS